MKGSLLTVLAGFLSLLSQAQTKAKPTSSMSIGKAVYTQRCMPCHQVDGRGAENMIPPLVKTEYILGAKARLISILLNGMKGEIKVNGDMYSNEMPSQASLTDSEIAAVLTYVR